VIDYNGIDREKFRPLDRADVCHRLGIDPNRRRVLYVGNLLPVKGPTVLAWAADQMQDVEVVFVGSGPEKITAVDALKLDRTKKSLVDECLRRTVPAESE